MNRHDLSMVIPFLNEEQVLPLKQIASAAGRQFLFQVLKASQDWQGPGIDRSRASDTKREDSYWRRVAHGYPKVSARSFASWFCTTLDAPLIWLHGYKVSPRARR